MVVMYGLDMRRLFLQVLRLGMERLLELVLLLQKMFRHIPLLEVSLRSPFENALMMK